MKNVGRAAREGRSTEVLAGEVKAARQRADAADARWREQTQRQAASIGRFVEFLQARNLMDDFNQWVAQRDAAKEEQKNG